jgi:hypothetical protein
MGLHKDLSGSYRVDSPPWNRKYLESGSILLLVLLHVMEHLIGLSVKITDPLSLEGISAGSDILLDIESSESTLVEVEASCPLRKGLKKLKISQ